MEMSELSRYDADWWSFYDCPLHGSWLVCESHPRLARFILVADPSVGHTRYGRALLVCEFYPRLALRIPYPTLSLYASLILVLLSHHSSLGLEVGAQAPSRWAPDNALLLLGKRLDCARMLGV